MDNELEQITKVYGLITEFLVTYSFQLLGALVVFLLGFWLAYKVADLLFNLCQKHKLDPTLSRFFSNLVRILIIVLTAIIALGKLGISVTPLVATIGAASLGAGLALQGLLSNYSAGITIIITRPYRLGDTVCVNGETGIVKEITLAMTYLVDEDGVEIAVPNRFFIGEILKNSHQYTLHHGVVGISYQDDPELAIHSILYAIAALPKIAQEPNPQVGIETFGDSSIDIGYRCWLPTGEYHALKYQLNFSVLSALKDAKVTIPFPQREVRLINKETS